MSPEQITQPVESIKVIEEQNQLLSAILDDIHEAVIAVDCDLFIRHLNRIAESLIGWSSTEASGHPVSEVVHLYHGNNSITTHLVQNVFNTNTKIHLEADTNLITRDGDKIPVGGSLSPIIKASGEVVGATFAIQDITRLRNAEIEAKFRANLDRIITQISTAFATAPIVEIDSEINAALENIAYFSRAFRSYVYLFNKEGTSLTCQYEWRAPGVKSYKGKTLKVSSVGNLFRRILSKEYVEIKNRDELSPDQSSARDWLAERNAKAFFAIPMILQNRAIGFIGIDSENPIITHIEEIEELINLVGNIFANAMGRRRNVKKLEEAREQEVTIGANIQRTLLLSEPPAAYGDLLIAAITIPSSQIDGDFYDFLLHLNGSMDVIFGDVMGKGIPAALLAAGGKTEFLRSLTHLLAISPPEALPQPQVIVNSVHSLLTPQLSKLDSFITLSYTRFDPNTKTISLVDCGNTRLIRCHTSDGSLEFLTGANLPLGFSLSEIYIQSEFEYAAGDLFFYYSDGVTEARSPQGEMFGLQRLSEVITANRHLSPGSLVRILQDTVTRFTESKNLRDDFTCIAIKVSTDVYGTFPGTSELELSSSLNELGMIRAFLRDFCDRDNGLKLSKNQRYLLELAVTEVASNITRHSYHGQEEMPIWVRIYRDSDYIRIRISHTGDSYEGPKKIQAPTLDTSREGGFGLYIVSRIVDDISYGKDENGRQYIELSKRLNP